jgi:hypothetical protein
LNGLYDARFDGAPVVALTGTTFHDLIGVRFQQSVDTVMLPRGGGQIYRGTVLGDAHCPRCERQVSAGISPGTVRVRIICKQYKSVRHGVDAVMEPPAN